MSRRAFWILFLFSVGTSALGLVYLQSESFANLLKKRIQEKAQTEMGIRVDFARLGVGFFPPSLSLIDVEAKVLSEKNTLKLDKDAVFQAQTLGFSFKIFQSFVKVLHINKVFVNDAQVRLILPKSESKEKSRWAQLVHSPIYIPISDTFGIQVRQLELRSVTLDLQWQENDDQMQIRASPIQYLAFTPETVGTEISLDVDDIFFQRGQTREYIRALKIGADISRKRIFISNLDLQKKEAALHGSGKIVGDIDNFSQSQLDLDLILRGPLDEISDYEPSIKKLHGSILANLRVVGKLKQPGIQGNIEVDNFSYSMWSLNKVTVSGAYEAGALVIDNLKLKKNDGMIQIKNKIEIPIPFGPNSLSFEAALSKVAYRDFAGELLEDINVINMDLDGKVLVKLDFTEKKFAEQKKITWALSVKPDVSVNNFELNNQTYKSKRKYLKIFRLAPFQTVGEFQWGETGLNVPGVDLKFKSGTMKVTGKLVKGQGFDIEGDMPNGDLGAEVGAIAGLPLQGEGSFHARVHGPNSKIVYDFDLAQRKAKFINFDFGDLVGRVTLDDHDSMILVNNLKGKRNTSEYDISGKVNIGEGDGLDLTTNFRNCDPNEIFQMFHHQIQDISWIPYGMTGLINGQAKVGGGYNQGIASLEINANVQGTDWSYLGETVDEIKLKAGVTNGTIFAKNIEANKRGSKLEGHVQYKASKELEYSLNVDKGKLRSLDWFSTYGLPVDGLVNIVSRGSGKWETLDSETKVQIRNGFMRTKPIPELNFLLHTDELESSYDLKIGTDIKAKVQMSNSEKRKSTHEFIFKDSNLTYLLCLLNRKVCSDSATDLRLSATGNYSWLGRNWQKMNGSAGITNFRLSKTGFFLKNTNPFQIVAENGLLRSNGVRLSGEDSKIDVKVQSRADGGNLEGNLQGTLSMHFLEFLTPLIDDGKGKLDFQVGLGGSFTNTTLSGAINAKSGFLRMSGLDAPVENIDGKIKLDGKKATVSEVTAQMGGGSVSLSGNVDVYLHQPPKLNLSLLLSGNRLKFFPLTYAEFTEAKLNFTGDRPPYLFSGLAKVKKAMMRRNFDISSDDKALQNFRYLPERISGSNSIYEIRLRAVAESGVMVQNDLLDAEFKGEITLLNNFEYPQIVGRGELVRGKFLFHNSAFTLDHAQVRMVNPDYFNPQYSIGGVANVENYKISLIAFGSTDKPPQVTVNSNPPLSQEDIISLLAFGYRGEDARKVGANDANAITYSEVGSILLDQLKLSQNLKSKGVQVSVVPSLGNSEERLIRASNGTPGVVSPKINIRTEVIRNLDAVFGSTVGASQDQSMDANLEYRLGRKTSVNAVFEQKQQTSFDAKEINSSFGADLKFRWGFK